MTHKSHISEEDRQERAVESAPRGGEEDTHEARVELGRERVHFVAHCARALAATLALVLAERVRRGRVDAGGAVSGDADSGGEGGR